MKEHVTRCNSEAHLFMSFPHSGKNNNHRHLSINIQQYPATLNSTSTCSCSMARASTWSFLVTSTTLVLMPVGEENRDYFFSVYFRRRSEHNDTRSHLATLLQATTCTTQRLQVYVGEWPESRCWELQECWWSGFCKLMTSRISEILWAQASLLVIL